MSYNPNLIGPNIVNEHADENDIRLLFGDFNDVAEPYVQLRVDCLDWAEIAVSCGFFPSKGQARKNGWAGPVPRGFGQRKFGKQGKGVWYFNPIGIEEELFKNVDKETFRVSDLATIRVIENGGIYINNERVDDIYRVLSDADLKDGSIKLSIGKKRHVLINPGEK